MKLIVKPESSNLWWGIYGLTEKTSWEDMSILHEDGTPIMNICLNTKQYLRSGLEDLVDDPEEADLIIAIENYLKDDKIHYWYYYSEKGSENFYEIPYEAPKNSEGVKPSFLDIWHPDENIGLSTIKSAVKAFAKKFLHIEHCQIEIDNIEKYEDSLKTFEEHQKLFGDGNTPKITFSQELITELSNLWGITEEDVLLQLKK